VPLTVRFCPQYSRTAPVTAAVRPLCEAVERLWLRPQLAPHIWMPSQLWRHNAPHWRAFANGYIGCAQSVELNCLGPLSVTSGASRPHRFSFLGWLSLPLVRYFVRSGRPHSTAHHRYGRATMPPHARCGSTCARSCTSLGTSSMWYVGCGLS
jgi:hypothetical protein